MPPTAGAGVEVRSVGPQSPRAPRSVALATNLRTDRPFMPFRFFTVPIQSTAEAEAELNAFLGSHKVLAVDRQWVDQGANSFWAVCVDYLVEGGSASPPKVLSGRSRVDYKEILEPAEFEVFSRLRGLRKEIATREAIPIYTVFTNEQLARFIQLRCRTRADLGRVNGVGEARLEKYGEKLLEFLNTLPEQADAAGGPPV
jgi:superfamily II DNA helicase RecQ